MTNQPRCPSCLMPVGISATECLCGEKLRKGKLLGNVITAPCSICGKQSFAAKHKAYFCPTHFAQAMGDTEQTCDEREASERIKTHFMKQLRQMLPMCAQSKSEDSG